MSQHYILAYMIIMLIYSRCARAQLHRAAMEFDAYGGAKAIQEKETASQTLALLQPSLHMRESPGMSNQQENKKDYLAFSWSLRLRLRLSCNLQRLFSTNEAPVYL